MVAISCVVDTDGLPVRARHFVIFHDDAVRVDVFACKLLAMDDFVQLHELLTEESQYAQRQAALKGEIEPKSLIDMFTMSASCKHGVSALQSSAALCYAGRVHGGMHKASV